MRKEWYFIRHGATAYNESGIVQGSGIDAPLSAKGIRQSMAFHRMYRSLPFDKVITSALQRTRMTVAPFAQQGVPVFRDASINEINWGIYEGQPSSPELKKAYRKITSQWAAGNYEVSADKGESAAQLMERLTGFVERLKQQDAPRILICSHGRSIRCLMTILHGVGLHEMEQFNHSNTGLYKVVFENGHTRLQLRNDTRHLDQL